MKSLSRKNFLKSAAFLGGTLMFSEVIMPTLSRFQGAQAYAGLSQNEYPFDSAEHIIYSVCLQCHTSCAIYCSPIRVCVL